MSDVLLKVPETPITAAQITQALTRRWLVHQHIVVPNCCVTGWESDLLILRKSGWMEEVEIKISASDFKREFEAKADKHERLVKGKAEYIPGNRQVIGRYDWTDCKPHTIRKFWFAMPHSLAEKLGPQIPEYAGLLSIRHGYNGLTTDVLREAPILKMSRKLTDAEQVALLRSTYHRYWDLKRGVK